jgi:hypothetical protein
VIWTHATIARPVDQAIDDWFSRLCFGRGGAYERQRCGRGIEAKLWRNKRISASQAVCPRFRSHSLWNRDARDAVTHSVRQSCSGSTNRFFPRSGLASFSTGKSRLPAPLEGHEDVVLAPRLRCLDDRKCSATWNFLHWEIISQAATASTKTRNRTQRASRGTMSCASRLCSS